MKKKEKGKAKKLTANQQLIKQGVSKIGRRAARKGMRGGFKSRNQQRRSQYQAMANRSVVSEGHVVSSSSQRSGKKTRKRAVGPTAAKRYRQEQALIRQEAYSKLSFDEKFDRLKKKEEIGLNCTRERARLERQQLQHERKAPQKKKKSEDKQT